MGYKIVPVEKDPFGEIGTPMDDPAAVAFAKEDPNVALSAKKQVLTDAARFATRPLGFGLRVGEAAIDALTAPGDILAGKLTESDPRFESSAQNAMLFLGGGLANPEEGAIGVFGGRGAKGADLNKLALAEKLDKSGASADHIWKTTGWFKGVDDKWRFEIPDLNARFQPEAKSVINDPNYYKLGSLLEHPQLLKNYPQLYDLATKLQSKRGGMFDNNIISQYNMSTLLHEIQHAIQKIEGFTFGTGSSAAPIQKAASYLGEKPEALYHQTAGEVEARNVEERFINRDTKTLPQITEDVPRNEQHLIENLYELVGELDKDPAAEANPIKAKASRTLSKLIKEIGKDPKNVTKDTFNTYNSVIRDLRDSVNTIHEQAATNKRPLIFQQAVLRSKLGGKNITAAERAELQEQLKRVDAELYKPDLLGYRYGDYGGVEPPKPSKK